MKVQEAIRTQLDFWHGTVEQMMSECSSDILHKVPTGSTADSIAGIYAHAVIAEDVIAHAFLQGKAPLYQEGGWESRLGIAFPGVPPSMTPQWAASVKMNVPVFQEYSKVVYAATDAYLAAVADAELDRKTQGPFGETTIGWMVSALLATHPVGHAGELAALKGVHGEKGLPF
jgi:hypothetical protein